MTVGKLELVCKSKVLDMLRLYSFILVPL